MKFDYVIGNPPYQDNTLGYNDSYAPPVYDKFIDASYTIADKVELIHPARFLFNAGSTPKEWNRKMLANEHFKILHCERNSKKIFPNTDIKGGIAISYYDAQKNFGKIGTFTIFDELNSIIKKVKNSDNFESLSKIAVSAYTYHFTENLYKENPYLRKRASKGHEYDLKSNVFEYLSEVFFDKKPNDGKEYVKILGRLNKERTYKYIRKDYLNEQENMRKYKIFIAGANGSGTLGETMSALIIGEPFTGTTESFMSIGYFDNENEVKNCLKYIKSKFNRVLLGVLKATPNITPDKYSYVPLQDFTEKSDIDWSKTIHEIDEQLYKKYKLTQDEINFIETHVKEME